ncbi:leucine--tRNA ligase [Candidatus Falkowbacteria bacterium]|nr:leucine--tRNA ligase [Candidatus Falkowbacteria bacterium]
MEKYNFSENEAKWQKYWLDNGLFAADDDSKKPKKYILDMFPYPSGAGLHIGHVESYTATDIYSRYCRLKGFNVLHPQGWDAFGLPAENYAIKTGVHPSETTKESIATFIRQINSMGFSYDWSREVNSSDPGYYKWTQWLFLLFYKNGLAYKKKAKVNWCDSCQTVLANEQAEGGVCDRCGSSVVQKDLEQWFFKISDFIEDQTAGGKTIRGLLSGLDDVDWPESTKAAQKNWIGRSEGAEIDFKIKDSELKIKVFTTRVDTIFGCTYVVVAPEHPLIGRLNDTIKNGQQVADYLESARAKTDLDRMEAKDKTGIALEGITAINPFNNEEVPVFVADYVLGNYGTGAVMAVPAHDERDWEFAKKYDLKIVEVISSGEGNPALEAAFTDDGVLVNSREYDGLASAAARKQLSVWLVETGNGGVKVNYKLRDWLISRQRYWGAPIPIIYCDVCGAVPVPEKDLPVILPTDVDFKPTGESPLVGSKTFHDVVCPNCGAKARRESDTMDTFVCSSWYYLRYADPKNDEFFASDEALKRWLPVDVYLGGAEHTVLHLLYARFFTKVLHKLGYVDFNEPFLKLRHQGIILGADGNKMSKSKGNVVNPDEVVALVGADALRMYEMFMGPLEEMKPWNTQGIVGITRFLDRTWQLQEKISTQPLEGLDKDMESLMHKTIKKVTEDIEAFKFNTAISALMIMLNEFEKRKEIPREYFSLFTVLLSPFAPHLAEELWQRLGSGGSVALGTWPEYDIEKTKDQVVKLVIQVNGKVREMVDVEPGLDETSARSLAEANQAVLKWLDGKEIKKVIYVQDKLINIVAA